MKKNIVYVLGAGFSAQVGLPTITNFFRVARDLQRSDEHVPPSVGRVLSLEQAVTPALRFAKVDTNNIEELLSITRIRQSCRADHEGQVFKIPEFISISDDDILQFIEYTIDRSTPQFTPVAPSENTSYSTPDIFSTMNKDEGLILRFVFSLFNYEYDILSSSSNRSINSDMQVSIGRPIGDGPNNSIISFNYDTVIERCVDVLNKRVFSGATSFRLVTPSKMISQDLSQNNVVPFCKLHGSLPHHLSFEKLSIIEPSHVKQLNEENYAHWAQAHELLSAADEIRFIGYSMPDTDSYVRYLLISAITKSMNLQKVTAVCLDKGEIVEKRFLRLWSDTILEYRNEKAERLLDSVSELYVKESTELSTDSYRHVVSVREA